MAQLEIQMKRKIAQCYFACLLLILFPTIIKSQVTIGSLAKPVEGAILDLKTHEATTANNITSDKGGLLLPRVILVSRNTLEPFVPIADPLWTTAGSRVKEKHAGLMVYNIHVSAETETNPDKAFRQGVYSWDGVQWVPAHQAKTFFRCPPFNLPLPWVSCAADEDLTYDLYGEYKKQFTADQNNLFVSNNTSLEEVSSSNLNRLYKANELDYVVTYYDASILTITAVDASGVMSYKVLDNDPEPSSFINIIFVTKE